MYTGRPQTGEKRRETERTSTQLPVPEMRKRDQQVLKMALKNAVVPGNVTSTDPQGFEPAENLRFS